MMMTKPQEQTPNLWRVGIVETRGRGFEADGGPTVWIEQRGAVTIRPDETIAVVVARWAVDRGYQTRDVRIRVLR